MSKEQKRMMEAPDKLVGLSANPLTKLFRKILEQRDIGSQVWNRRLTNYLNSPFSVYQRTQKTSVKSVIILTGLLRDLV